MKFQEPKQVKIAIERIEAQGFRAYLVGGCVRDYLMGITPKDFDLSTDAKPKEIKDCFKEFSVIETGIKHGTVTVVIDHFSIEITTHRLESNYSDHRRPDAVVFTKELDLSRRDFTINAMAYDLNQGLVDYFGGEEDLKKRMIRCVGDPNQRFAEDALRILRGLRFASVLGFKIEEKTREGMLKHKEQLKNISAERIASELTKGLCGKNVKEMIVSMTAILGVVIPELLPMKGFEQNNPHHSYDVLTHTAVALENTPPIPHLRWAVLLHDVAKPETYCCDEKGVGHFYGHAKLSEKLAKKRLKALNCDNQTIHQVGLLIRYHDLVLEPNKKSLKRWLNRLSQALFLDLLQVKRADILGQSPRYWQRIQTLDQIKRMINEIIQEKECFARKDLAVNGWDLIDLGMSGPKIKKVLDALLDEVINEVLPNEKEALLKKAKELKDVN